MTKRTAGALGAAVVAAGILAGALAGSWGSIGGNRPSGTPRAGTTATGSPTGATAPGSHAASPGAGASSGTKPSARATRGTRDPRAGIPVVTVARLTGISYGAATSADRSRFRKVGGASAGLLTGPTVRSVSVDGERAGAVAVYATKAKVKMSPVFQDQYIVQLLTAMTGSTRAPKFVHAQGQVTALSNGHVSAAGWFSGSKVVLLYRGPGAPDLTRLAATVQGTPPGS